MPKSVKALPTPELDKPLTPALLGECVRAKRTQLGFRIDEAAQYLGVAKDTLMQLEKGHPGTQLSSTFKILHGLGLQMQMVPWLEEEEGEWF